MNSLTINFGLISKMRTQCNDTSRGWREIQIRDTNLMKTNSRKMIS